MNLLAQAGSLGLPDVTINQSNTLYRVTDFGLLITRVLNVAVSIVGLLILGYIIWGAVDWILAQGDKSKIESARAKITQGVVGAGVFLSVFAIYAIISYFLGLGKHLDITGLNGGGTGGTGGTSTCNTGTIGQTFNDGGAGGYCSGGGAATVKCVGAGVGPSGFSYPHFEPCSCLSGTLLPGYSTSGCQ